LRKNENTDRRDWKNNIFSAKKSMTFFAFPGLPDFSWYNLPKREKYTKLLQNIPKVLKFIPSGFKIDQLSMK
jgi:hypothetical protein